MWTALMPTRFFFLAWRQWLYIGSFTRESMGIYPRQNWNLMSLDLNLYFKHSFLQFKFAIIELEIGIQNDSQL